jgi:lysozyme
MKARLSQEAFTALVRFEGLFRYGKTSPRIAPPGPGADLSREDSTKIYSYMDPINLETIGIGHLLTENEKRTGIIEIFGQRVSWRNGLTLSEVNALKNQDLLIHTEPFWRAKWPRPITQNQFDALAMLSFNVGVNRIVNSSRSTVARLMREGDYEGAANAFMSWTKAGGRELPGLVRRRSWEREHFLKNSDVLIDTNSGVYLGRGLVENSRSDFALVSSFGDAAGQFDLFEDEFFPIVEFWMKSTFEEYF